MSGVREPPWLTVSVALSFVSRLPHSFASSSPCIPLPLLFILPCPHFTSFSLSRQLSMFSDLPTEVAKVRLQHDMIAVLLDRPTSITTLAFWVKVHLSDVILYCSPFCCINYHYSYTYALTISSHHLVDIVDHFISTNIWIFIIHYLHNFVNEKARKRRSRRRSVGWGNFQATPHDVGSKPIYNLSEGGDKH